MKAMKVNEAKAPIYWAGKIGDFDDFGDMIFNEFIDGKTNRGPWAIMTPTTFDTYGVGKLGTGYGQRYRKQANGKWLKVEG